MSRFMVINKFFVLFQTSHSSHQFTRFKCLF
jgi:hypothetical protein